MARHITLITTLLALSAVAHAQIPAAGGADLAERALFPRKYLAKRDSGWNGVTTLVVAGTTGVSAMQAVVISNDEVLIFDKAENNPLRVAGHAAWGSIYTISDQSLRPLNLITNSFCAGGGWLGNGTLASIGGNPPSGPYGSQDGHQAIRLFTPCKSKTCDVYENPQRLHLTSNRWYPSTTRLPDGSLLIVGGMLGGGYNNALITDNPTMEFYPPKGNGMNFYSPFLHDALNTNLFPVTFALPNGLIFVAANHIAMLYNWQTRTEQRLPNFPNGVRVSYPASAATALLPLTIANNWTPEVFIAGGTTANTDASPSILSSQIPASDQVVRMVLNSAGIAGGWVVEHLPEPRLMGDAIITPDGKVFIVNGAKSGVAGYGNVRNEVGASNAANPTYRPCLYDPLAPAGQRFSTNFPSSSIERVYHSSATLIPDGRIWIAGSNPNNDVSNTAFKTRYDVEIFSPPYVSAVRPTYKGLPRNILYNTQFQLRIKVYPNTKLVSVVLMDLGYSTHGVHMSQKSVELVSTREGTRNLTVTGPVDSKLLPPGPAWLFVIMDGIPSKGFKVLVGDGSGPPVNQAAINNMLVKTTKKAPPKKKKTKSFVA